MKNIILNNIRKEVDSCSKKNSELKYPIFAYKKVQVKNGYIMWHYGINGLDIHFSTNFYNNKKIENFKKQNHKKISIIICKHIIASRQYKNYIEKYCKD